MGRRILGIVLVVVGVLAFAGSFFWENEMVPRLVKYPDDLDTTPQYSGQVVLYLDPATYAPLAEPKQFPLTVVRNIKSNGDLTSSDTVVVDETLTLTAEGLFENAVQKHRYVMDRREMVNVTDDRAYAFIEDNTVDRAGAYRLAFPFDTPEQPYPIYNNNIEGTYDATPADPSEGEVEGMATLNFVATKEPTPVAAAYLAWLNEVNPLPEGLTLEQLTPILKAAGFDLATDLGPIIAGVSEADRAKLIEFSQKSTPLVYTFSFKGYEAVERETGSPLRVSDVTETVAALPDAAAVGELRDILAAYPDLPQAANAVQVLDKLAAEPIPVLQNVYSQSDESVADVADEVRDAKSQKNLAENTIPTVLLVVGVILAVVGVVLLVLPRRKGKGEGSGAAPTTPTPVSIPD